jgi:hypothetical protein
LIYIRFYSFLVPFEYDEKNDQRLSFPEDFEHVDVHYDKRTVYYLNIVCSVPDPFLFERSGSFIISADPEY